MEVGREWQGFWLSTTKCGVAAVATFGRLLSIRTQTTQSLRARMDEDEIKASDGALFTLPADLICKVFSHLYFQEKLQCQRVCKAWNACLREPQALVWGKVRVPATRRPFLELFTDVERCDPSRRSAGG